MFLLVFVNKTFSYKEILSQFNHLLKIYFKTTKCYYVSLSKQKCSFLEHLKYYLQALREALTAAKGPFVWPSVTFDNRG